MKLPELLSPAGDMESLRAAVENGADAVYMGGRNFNARRNAANFCDEEFVEAMRYAHARGVNIYITMNTLVSDAEMPEAVAAAGLAYEAGADALIVQDLGFASVLRKHIPDLPLHLSTQGTVYSAEGVRALAPMGFARVILARELSFSEIEKAVRGSMTPVEVFAHGALCVCYSGQCLMSSMIGCRSGNRGLCAQPCRLPYKLGGAQGYLLSPKDLCTLGLLPELAGRGVAALKIEGRMKSPEYVAAVTRVYRKYLDLIAAGGEYRVDAADLQDLLLAFDRGGFTEGYLRGGPGAALIARKKPPVPDEVRRAAVRALEARAQASFTGAPRRKVGISGRFAAKAGEPMRLEVWDGGGNRAEAACATPAEAARRLPLSAETAREQIKKTGGTPFEFTDIAVEVDGRAAAKLSELNALRRDALAALESIRAGRYSGRRAGEWAASPPGPPAAPAQPSLSLYLYRWRGELADALHLAARVYAPFADAVRGRVRMDRRPKELMAWLPPVTNGGMDGLIREHAGRLKDLGLDGVLTGNAGHIEMLGDCGLPLWGDASLNIFNGWALRAYAGLGLKGITLSHELTMAQIAALPDCGIEKEAAVYGRLPLMRSAYCPAGSEAPGASAGKACGRCAGGGAYGLVDRTGACFPIVCGPGDCRCTILNADILHVPPLAARLADAGVSALRLYVYDEPPEEVARLLVLYRKALAGEIPGGPLGRGFTKGHYFRGV
jgi:putative protease